jgi:hypothetical protein
LRRAIGANASATSCFGEDCPPQAGDLDRRVGKNDVDAPRVSEPTHTRLITKCQLDHVIPDGEGLDRRPERANPVGDQRGGAIRLDLSEETVWIGRHEAGLAPHQQILADQLHLTRLALPGLSPPILVGEQVVERVDIHLGEKHTDRLPVGDDGHGGEHLRCEVSGHIGGGVLDHRLAAILRIERPLRCECEAGPSERPMYMLLPKSTSLATV